MKLFRVLKKKEGRFKWQGLKEGVFVIDISNLSEPKTIAVSKLPGSVEKLIIWEDKKIAIVANGEEGLQLIDIKKLYLLIE